MIKTFIFCVYFLCLATNLTIAQEAGEIKVVVSDIPSNDGQIRAALYNSPEGFPAQVDQSLRHASVVVNGDTAIITFSEVAFGDYVLAVFHDENNNGSLDTNNKGIPLEALGVSGDAKMKFGPPKYERAIFTVDGEFNEIAIPLQQFKVNANN